MNDFYLVNDTLIQTLNSDTSAGNIFRHSNPIFSSLLHQQSCFSATMAVDLSQVFTGKNGNLLPPFLWMVICLVLWVLANYIFAVISHLRASFPAVLLLSVRLMAGHIKETFILLFTMAGACLIVFLVPGLFVLFPGILCGIASHLIEPGLKKALAID